MYNDRFLKGYIREIESLEGKGKIKEAIEICKAGLLIDNNDTTLQNKKKQLEGLLQSSGTPLTQSLMRYIRFFLFANIILYCLPYFGGSSSYYRSLYADLTVNILTLYMNIGIPQFSAISAYIQKAISDPSTMKIFYAILLLFGRTYFMALFPILLSHLVIFTPELFTLIQSQLPPFESTISPLLSKYAPQVHFQQLASMFSKNQLNNFKYQLVQLSAFSEVMLGVYFIIEVILPTRNIMMTMIYWQYLQMRYIFDKSGSIHLAFLQLDKQIITFVSYKFVPSIVKNLYMKLKSFLAQKVTRNPNESPMSKCCIM